MIADERDKQPPSLREPPLRPADPAPTDEGPLRLMPGPREVWRNLSALVLWALALVMVLLSQMRWWQLRPGPPPLPQPGDSAWLHASMYVPLGAIVVLAVLFWLASRRWVGDPVVRGRIRFWGVVLSVLSAIFSVMMTAAFHLGRQTEYF